MILLIVIVLVIGAILVHFLEEQSKTKAHDNARDDVVMIVEIIEQYRETYGAYPIVTARTDEQSASSIIRLLAAVRTPMGRPVDEDTALMNPEMISFAKPFLGRRTINGMIVDPWGNPYHIAIDTNGDGTVELDSRDSQLYSSLEEFVLKVHLPVIAWSDGPDRRNDFGFGDDICSWHR